MKKIKVRDTIGWHMTSTEFSKELQEAVESGEEIQIHVNSPGGSVYQGWEMYNEIKMAVSEGADIKMYNIGLAASIASIIFLAVPKENRFMAETSLYMIHNPKGLAFGEKKDMKKEMELLEKIEDLSADIYAKETNTEAGYMQAKMNVTTWYKPEEAKNEGFFNIIVDGYDDVEEVQVVGMQQSAFASMPSNCKVNLCFEDKKPNIKSESSFKDLTKISNSQIRETIWMNYLKS